MMRMHPTQPQIFVTYTGLLTDTLYTDVKNVVIRYSRYLRDVSELMNQSVSKAAADVRVLETLIQVCKVINVSERGAEHNCISRA